MQIIRSICKLISRSSTQQQLQRTMSTAAERRSKRLKRVNERLVWVDLEMSGLDIEKEHILEMACLVTDADLNIIAETEDLVINQPDSVLDNMDDWCKKHHGESGLTEAVRNSKISVAEAEKKMLDFVREHTIPGKAPLAGNTIHMDRLFLAKYMPNFTQHLHYRLVDVSTIKELSRRWYTREFSKAPKKKLSHRALDDIKESIAELQYYRENVFKPYVDSNESTEESNSDEEKSNNI